MNEEKNNLITDTESELINKLKPRERKFCELYLQTGKKEQSAKDVGYSEKSARTQASRLLKNENILAYIHALQKRAREELHIDENWAVLKALEVYERCMQAVPVTEWDYSEHKMVETGEYTFDSKGALKALDLIRTLLGIGPNDESKLQTAIMIVNNIGDTDVE